MQFLCIGDVALADGNLSHWVWVPPGGVIPGDDVRVLFNWELPIGDAINPRPRARGPRLLAYPDSLSVIRRWSPGFAALATNHILDAGEEGLANTIGSLNRAGFTTVGAGRTRGEITTPLFWETADGRLAVVNWVFPETHPDWMSVPGPNCWPGLEGAERIIRELKRNTDWVLIVVHWSDEHFPYPRPEDRAVANGGRLGCWSSSARRAWYGDHRLLPGFLQHRQFLLLGYLGSPWWLDHATSTQKP